MTGSVWLVGAGPGDPELLTLKARRLLDEADVVVHDRLGCASVVQELPPTTRLIDVGKSPHHHPVPQDEINQILVREARAGHRVVRLKGGDPFVLGRGGEELRSCREAGVACEVVPGVSSAISAPASAGIPVTHRGLSTGFLVLSGHEEVDVDQLAATAFTIVILMGMYRLPTLAPALVAAGKDPLTPCAVIQEAWSDRQREVRAPLSQIAVESARAGLANPAVIVIGDVAEGV